MGLQAGLNSVKSDYASLIGSIHDPNDPGLRFERQTSTAFQFGAGMYYKSPKFEFGLSAPVLFSSGNNLPQDSLGRLSTMPHLFIFSTYKYQLTSSVELAPSILLKSRTGSPFGVDINMAASLKGAILVALSYRSFESMSTILQMRVLPQMKIGYAYDFPLTDAKRRYFNSHEIMLNYVFKYNNYNVKSPR
jgi:type IX secretion system PorP/SprF family membrane protein